MIRNSKSLKSAVREYLQTRNDWTKLKKQDQDFLVFSLHSFIESNATKFIAGSVKHADSDFLTETDHVGEALNEVRDNWNYMMALKYKAAKRK